MNEEKNKGFFLNAILILIIIVSFVSFFKGFLNLSYLFTGGRTTFYMVDMIRLIAFVNIIFTGFLFKMYKWSFFAVIFATGSMLLLSIFAGRPHLIVIYLILLIGLFLSIRKKMELLI